MLLHICEEKFSVAYNPLFLEFFKLSLHVYWDSFFFGLCFLLVMVGCLLVTEMPHWMSLMSMPKSQYLLVTVLSMDLSPNMPLPVLLSTQQCRPGIAVHASTEALLNSFDISSWFLECFLTFIFPRKSGSF